MWVKVNGKTGPVRKIAANIVGGRDVPVPLCPSCLRLSLLILHLKRDIQIDWEKELSGINGEEDETD